MPAATSDVRQLEPGRRPPAAPQQPPPRRKALDELQPATPSASRPARASSGTAGPLRSVTSAGDTHHTSGDLDAAREAREQARAVLEELQHPDAEQVRRKLKALA